MALENAGFVKLIPENNQLFSIFIKCRKPSAAAYRRLIEATGCEPREILFIDDKSENIEAANHYGIKGIVFNGQKESQRDLIGHLARFGIVISS